MNIGQYTFLSLIWLIWLIWFIVLIFAICVVVVPPFVNKNNRMKQRDKAVFDIVTILFLK